MSTGRYELTELIVIGGHTIMAVLVAIVITFDKAIGAKLRPIDPPLFPP